MFWISMVEATSALRAELSFHMTSTGITINVLTPFKENYRIEGGMIEIHDLFLDQKQLIDVEQANNFFLNILIYLLSIKGAQIHVVEQQPQLALKESKLVGVISIKRGCEGNSWSIFIVIIVQNTR